MKSQRRHDLKQNVLSIELAHIRDFLKRRGNLLAWAALIVALGIFIFVYVRSRHQGQIEDVRVRFEQLQAQAENPEVKAEDIIAGLKSLADQDSDPRVAALATVTLGDQCFMRSIVGQAAQAEQKEVGRALPKSQQKELLDQAGTYYRKVLQNFPTETDAVARAYVGLAKLAEDRGDFEEAAKEYDSAIALNVTGAAVTAQEGKARLAEIKSAVPMATTMPAEEKKPQTQPATAPAAGPAATRPAVEAEPATKPAAPPAPAPAPAAKPATQPAPTGTGVKKTPATSPAPAPAK